MIQYVISEAIGGALWETSRLTLLAVVVTMAAAAIARWREHRSEPGRFRLSRKARPEAPQHASSGLWSVPFLVWALETSLVFQAELDAFSSGLTSPGPEGLFGAMLASTVCLGLLAGIQGLACVALGYREGVLGIAGKNRAAVGYAVLAALLDMFFYLTVGGLTRVM